MYDVKDVVFDLDWTQTDLFLKISPHTAVALGEIWPDALNSQNRAPDITDVQEHKITGIWK
jgi:hypothetical protein